MGIAIHTFFYSNNRGIGVLANLEFGVLQELEISEPHDWSQIVWMQTDRVSSELFFYSNNSGTGAVGYVPTGSPGDASFVQSDLVPGFNKNWSHILSATFFPPDDTLCYLFFYSKGDGVGEVGKIDRSGNYQTTTGPILGFNKNWSYIIPAFSSSDAKYLFFYSNEGVGAVGKIDSNGNYQTTTASILGFNKNWSHIVPAFSSSDATYLFFYSNEGVGAVGKIDKNGNYQTTTGSIPGFNKNWSHIVPVYPNHLFFYSNVSGIGSLGKIDSDGNYQTTIGSIPLLKDFTHIIEPSVGFLFFYSSISGMGATARIKDDEYQPLSNIPDFPKDWSQITTIVQEILH